MHFTKEKLKFLCKKQHLYLSIFYKCWIFSYICRFFCYFFKKLLTLWYDYWHWVLITNFLPGSSKWNTPFAIICLKMKLTHGYQFIVEIIVNNSSTVSRFLGILNFLLQKELIIIKVYRVSLTLRIFRSGWNYFAIWLRMLSSFWNDVDIL